MTVTTSLNLAAVRSGIAQVIKAGIPEIVKVTNHVNYTESVNNLPLATIERGEIQGQDITLQGESADAQLGGYDHLITWMITVLAAFNTVVEAQELDDILAGRFLDAFNGNRLIDPNGPGAVDSSRVPLIVPFIQDEEHAPLWVSQVTLRTFIISTL